MKPQVVFSVRYLIADIDSSVLEATRLLQQKAGINNIIDHKICF